MLDYILNIFSDFLFFVLHIGKSGSFPPALSQKEENRLKYFEYGGRPLVVFYANFCHDHWMGREDMLCDTDEQMRESVARVKRMADDYELLRSVRY